MSQKKVIIYFLFLVVLIGLSAIVWQIKDAVSSKEAVFAAINSGEKVADTQVGEYQYSAPWDKDIYDSYYLRAEKLPEDLPLIKGGIVPHHLLAGQVDATFFNGVAKQKPSLIVLIGPNHFSRGKGDIIATRLDWQTPYGIVQTDKEMLAKVSANIGVQINEAVMKEEHSIYSLVPFVAKSLPNTKVISFILRNNTATGTLDKLVRELKNDLPPDAVIVASIDFSHYQTLPVANFHDELSMNVIKTFDYDRLAKLEIDSVPSVYTLLRLMESFGTQKVFHEMHTNSATITGQPSAPNTTSHYSPYFSAGLPETDKAVSILSFGDIMLDRNVKKQIDAHGNDYLFTKLAGEEQRFFSGMDIAQANLEGSFANSRRQTPKSIAFRFDPKLMAMLKKYNFSVFDLANNHAFDMSSAGFRESKTNLAAAGFEFYGNEYNVNAKDSLLIKTIANKKIAFVGLNITEGQLEQSLITDLIKKAKSEADKVIVNIHWGEEYKELSNNNQRSLAYAMIDAGADVIIGHHPHVTEEIEMYKDKPIFYSLGNFVFDQYFSVPTQQGLGVGLVLYQNKTSIYFFPLQSNQSQVTLMNGENLANFSKNWIDRSRLGAYNFSDFYLQLTTSYENK